MVKQIVVFDIDGVLADDSPRHMYLSEHRDHTAPEWANYYEAAVKDKPLNLGYWLHFGWHTVADAEIYFSTGRPEKYRRPTAEWLDKNLVAGPGANRLLMRPKTSHASNTELKLTHMDAMGGPDAITVWHDDNPAVIECFQALGVPAVYIPSKGWKDGDPRRAVTHAAYERFIGTTRTYPHHDERGHVEALLYVLLGLGEAGEIQGKGKKILRDDGGVLTDERRLAMLAETGDLYWYVAELTRHLGSNLADLAAMNMDKLGGRLVRGTISGDGDYR